MMNKWFSFALVLLASLLASCTHKEFADLSVKKVPVRVEFDWQNSPDANPAGMCVYFYNSVTDEYRRVDFPGMTGGIVLLPEGTWHVMTFNNDTEGVLFGNEHDFWTHCAFTRSGNVLEGALGNGIAPRAPETDEERVVITPDMMWGHNIQDFDIHLQDGQDEVVITLYPEELVCTYTYEIRNVENLGSVVRMCSALSGMSGQLTFQSGELHTECVTLPLEANKKDASTIEGKFYTFGHHEANEQPHRVTLYLWLDDGRKLVYGTTRADKWDVTSQIHSAPDPRRVHYIIDGLDIPANLEEGEWNPSADDWQSEEYDVEL